ncbi:L,D-transpeptidase [Actinomycetospora termitidis]|uniref:L,D-transpeptidase n=1 Tax=Actinomycetospora termitidis TaxID=3053470 RepID=A0ABT7MCT0_9PSEU|nr:L,D-transpeptidase [Actinomycetospora sp. Odt1-22]MDL5158469.1 L,D-transpeptidase [Actinomycetospora sp. Odt1-22]
MGRHHRAASSLTGGSGARLRVGVGSIGAVGASLLAMGAPAVAAPAAAPAPASSNDSATPCAPTAKACVDISAKKAWLTDGHGKVLYGPVPITTGGKGYETPTGTFSVMWKDKDHTSDEYDGAPMNNSVFFAPGDAFHEGSLQRDSAGCVHLSHDASEKFFDTLNVYDQVQIVP